MYENTLKSGKKEAMIKLNKILKLATPPSPKPPRIFVTDGWCKIRRNIHIEEHGSKTIAERWTQHPHEVRYALIQKIQL
jgi:hypothetical protein